MLKNHLFYSAERLPRLLMAFLLCTSFGVLQGQNPCPPVNGARTTNPTFPGCLPPGGDPFRVVLIIDESGSINFGTGFEDEFEDAVTQFATTLHNAVTGPGQMEMGVVEFSDVADNVIRVQDVFPDAFVTAVTRYLNGENTGFNPNYQPNGGTLFKPALDVANAIPNIDMIFFLTDGNPGDPINDWQPVANALKCEGTYIFGIGLGTGITDVNIRALSGDDKLNDPKSLQGGADWSLESFSSLPASLVELAESQIDTKKPVVSCPDPIRTNNDPGSCGKVVTYTSTATDNCGDINPTCSPASGSFFNVGRTDITCTATDNAGNAATCSFSVTVNDLEPPSVACPPTKIISCDESLEPANTGSAGAFDNCGIQSTTHTDVRINGSCPNSFTVQRTWRAVDIHGNFNECLQTIKVFDNTPPVITCPPAATVSCDIGPNAASGLATATDNCDTDVAISSSDRTLNGDCDWFCNIERTWLAADDCGNTASCVQKVTRDVTPKIEEALNADIDGDGVVDTLKLGASQNTLTLPPGTGHCVVHWLPGSGSTPVGLEHGHPVVDPARCLPGSNLLDGSNHLIDPLVAEALTLNILVRLDPDLGKKKINTLSCTIAPIVIQNLGRRENSDINELLRVTNTALGKIALQPHLRELLEALRCINDNTPGVCD